MAAATLRYRSHTHLIAGLALAIVATLALAACNDSTGGSAPAPAAGLRVHVGSLSAPQLINNAEPAGPTHFGGADVGDTSNPRTILLHNPGDGPLVVGMPRVWGPNSADFSVSNGLAAQIDPNTTASFDILFTPTVRGLRVATVTFTHNALGEQPVPFNIEVAGTATETGRAGLDVRELSPDGRLVRPGAPAIDGARRFDVREPGTGPSAARTFVVRNHGDNTLTLGVPSLIGPEAGSFVIGTASMSSSVAPGAHTTFTIAFEPESAGAKNAVVTFVHFPNGSASPSVFDFEVAGNGGRMFFWGGSSPELRTIDGGGMFDPVTNEWLPIGMTGSPGPRHLPTVVSTGTRVIVWGGNSGITFSLMNTGAVYHLSTETWVPMGQTNAPSVRRAAPGIWTGKQMITWGGQDIYALPTGGTYDPMRDEWVRMSRLGEPTARWAHTLNWTGTHAIVWGGRDHLDNVFGDGKLYDVATDTWTPVSPVGAPSPRHGHTAVWTGDRLVVWGGVASDGSFLADGAKYDPLHDRWEPMATDDAPTGRTKHTATWTGAQMLIWGGRDAGGLLNTGRRYDPLLDEWFPVSPYFTIDPREDHNAVFTGRNVIIWGGRFGPYGPLPFFYHQTGGIYDAFTNSWVEPTPLTNAPPGREGFTAVWIGPLNDSQ